jgi:uncharacterized integral membrane protein
VSVLVVGVVIVVILIVVIFRRRNKAQVNVQIISDSFQNPLEKSEEISNSQSIGK